MYFNSQKKNLGRGCNHPFTPPLYPTGYATALHCDKTIPERILSGSLKSSHYSKSFPFHDLLARQIYH